MLAETSGKGWEDRWFQVGTLMYFCLGGPQVGTCPLYPPPHPAPPSLLRSCWILRRLGCRCAELESACHMAVDVGIHAFGWVHCSTGQNTTFSNNTKKKSKIIIKQKKSLITKSSLLVQRNTISFFHIQYSWEFLTNVFLSYLRVYGFANILVLYFRWSKKMSNSIIDFHIKHMACKYCTMVTVMEWQLDTSISVIIFKTLLVGRIYKINAAFGKHTPRLSLRTLL